MTRPTGHDGRRFLFLQGPHGPFFSQLARMLRTAGAKTWRVGFNAGDAAFWRPRQGYIPFRDAPEAWPAHFQALIVELGITDLVLYGDTRPIHAKAIEIARDAGLTIHVFEEGYLRPWWITYERDGSNGNSRLMSMSLDEMRTALGDRIDDHREAPAHWGSLRAHVFYGALYHGLVMAGARAYPGFRPHRRIPVRTEFRLHLRRLLLMPAHAVQRIIATRRIMRGGYPYHLVLLQLAHDASFLDHGPFPSMEAFLDRVIADFASGAPPHHHLVFKAHPLEDGRAPLRREISRIARLHGIGERVHFLRGGKLAPLLDPAVSAVTVNSTAGQQALWRGLPLKALGRAIYSRRELASAQPLFVFFANPQPPDGPSYRLFRAYLLATSQVPGSFYTAKGRHQALRRVADMVLAQTAPYAALCGKTAPSPAFHVVGKQDGR
ncbi:MAG: capsule biosynthesis protein CapA [Rhodobacteraceae bacterium]|nr:capsule biosynthesis protein CapA [Paracoccaceae bacterium]